MTKINTVQKKKVSTKAPKDLPAKSKVSLYLYRALAIFIFLSVVTAGGYVGTLDDPKGVTSSAYEVKEKQPYVKEYLSLGEIYGLDLIKDSPCTTNVMDTTEKQFAEELRLMINIYRVSNGLTELKYLPVLEYVAGFKSYEYSKTRVWAHDLDGTGDFGIYERCGFKQEYMGEVLARYFTKSTDVFNAWKNSPTHNAILLAPEYNSFAIMRRSKADDYYTIGFFWKQ